GLTLILNPNGLYWAVLQSAAVSMSATCPAVGIANAALTSSGRASALWNVPLFPTVGEVSFVFIVILCLHRRLGGFCTGSLTPLAELVPHADESQIVGISTRIQ